MAELEEEEHGDTGRAREWMARALNAARDPAWTADGLVSDRWLPVSPLTGRLDVFEWRVPLAELAADRPVIEQHDVSVTAPPPELAPLQAPADAPAEKEPHAATAAAPSAQPARKTPPRTIQPVIPLVHAPDDPGPEPPPEPAAATSGWRRLRSLFASLG
jgi:HemY protein